MLRDDDQHVFFVLNLENDKNHVQQPAAHTLNLPFKSLHILYVSVIDYSILNMLLLDVVVVFSTFTSPALMKVSTPVNYLWLIELD